MIEWRLNPSPERGLRGAKRQTRCRLRPSLAVHSLRDPCPPQRPPGLLMRGGCLRPIAPFRETREVRVSLPPTPQVSSRRDSQGRRRLIPPFPRYRVPPMCRRRRRYRRAGRYFPVRPLPLTPRRTAQTCAKYHSRFRTFRRLLRLPDRLLLVIPMGMFRLPISMEEEARRRNRPRNGTSTIVTLRSMGWGPRAQSSIWRKSGRRPSPLGNR
jgi:hypothetical protein